MSHKKHRKRCECGNKLGHKNTTGICIDCQNKKNCLNCNTPISRTNISGFCPKCTFKVNGHHLKGTTQSAEYVEKRVSMLRGRKRPEHAVRMRKVYYQRKEGGDVLSFKGYKHSDEHKNSMKGEGNPVWNGGTHFEPYAPVWTEEFKEFIRKRDNHTCQVCGEVYTSGRKFSVHHIDYDKKNCQPSNLTTLCIGCHGATLKDKGTWTTYFNRKMVEPLT